MRNAPSKTNIVTAALEKEILSGKYKPGDKLPSFRELAAQFDVSTMVIHQAAVELAEKGMLLRGPRSGLFIPAGVRHEELCGFVTSVLMGTMENYYESFMQTSAESGCVAMTVREDSASIESMLAKRPLRVFVDMSGMDCSLNMVKKLTAGYDTVFCNRFEWTEGVPESGVLSDWKYITEATLRHFIEAGHKRILFVSHNQAMPEYKRRELIAAAEAVGIEFESPEFQWCCYRDFQGNPERLVNIYRKNPPTAVFGRGDQPVFEFTRRAALFFPEAPEPEKVGAFNSFWSNQPEREFSSWQWNWQDLWRRAFAHKEKNIEYYRPKLITRQQKESLKNE